jgi:alpha-galactosidase
MFQYFNCREWCQLARPVGETIMKSLLLILAILPGSLFAGDRAIISLSEARFTTGDDPAWRLPEFDDSGWRQVSTAQGYEQQGFKNYDGYSWYRLHVQLPTSFRRSAGWQERLRIFLSAIDDVDETYLNGVQIGHTGRMPGDPLGYDTKWQAEREYFVDLSTDLVRWDRDNIIAVRVFDGSGGGGIYKAVPTISMVEKIDGIQINAGDATYKFAGAKVTSTAIISNILPVKVAGVLSYEIHDEAAQRLLKTGKQHLSLAAQSHASVDTASPQRAGITVTYRFTEDSTRDTLSVTHVIPYLQTPSESLRPRINGATALGVRPGSPLQFQIAATGRPLRFTADNLPPGFTLNPQSGLISGVAGMDETSYRVKLTAANAHGSVSRDLVIRVGQKLALTPPMGWNSWNVFGLGVTDAQVRAMASAMRASGLADHGWTYVNVDDGWQAAKRQPNGTLTGNEKFPDMAELAGFVHSLGLKFGVYSTPGPLTCGRYPGSLDHVQQDAESYARWGVDYLKYDQCSYSDRLTPASSLADFQLPYRLMGTALRQQHRDIVYSLCQYGEREVWNWGASVGGQSWRVSGDIEDTWPSVLATGFDAHRAAASTAPGAWADPDMLVVGRVGWGGSLHASRLTPDEQYSHISLWSLLAAPLLLGNDLSALDEFTRNLLANDEVLAINQDALGMSALRKLEQDDWQVWVKPLADGDLAVGIFNLADKYRRWPYDPGIWAHPMRTTVRDVWRQRDLPALKRGQGLGIPAHGVLLLKVAK